MRKLITAISLLIVTLSYGQQLDKKVGVVGSGYTQLNFTDNVEFGVITGVNLKDYALVGLFHQTSIRSNHFSGLYTKINLFPKLHHVSVGLETRTGLVNGKYLSIEPAFSFHINNKNDKFRLTHSLGIKEGLPAYTFGVMFGNFGPKYWKN